MDQSEALESPVLAEYRLPRAAEKPDDKRPFAGFSLQERWIATFLAGFSRGRGWLDGCRGFGYTALDPLYILIPPLEESDEAHVPAKSPQEGEDPWFSQAYEHRRGQEGHSGPPSPGSEAPGSLTGAPEQAHAPYGFFGVREGLQAGHGL